MLEQIGTFWSYEFWQVKVNLSFVFEELVNEQNVDLLAPFLCNIWSK